MIAVLLVIVFPSVGTSEMPADSADEAGLKNMISNFKAAWTKCDKKALAALLAEDGDFQSPYDFFAKGRAAIEAFYSGVFSSGYCGSKGEGEIASIRFVQPGLAIMDGTWRISGAHDQSGDEAPEEKGRFTAVATKGSGAWLIVAQREMIPAVPR